MAKLYAKKILSGDINAATGEPWTLEDVPERWRATVEEMLPAEEVNGE